MARQAKRWNCLTHERMERITLSQGLRHDSHQLIVPHFTTRECRRTALVSCTLDTNTEGGVGGSSWRGGAQSLIKATLQDALKRKGDKLEALARVELVLKLHPETERQTEQRKMVNTWILFQLSQCWNIHHTTNKVLLFFLIFKGNDVMKVCLCCSLTFILHLKLVPGMSDPCCFSLEITMMKVQWY